MSRLLGAFQAVCPLSAQDDTGTALLRWTAAGTPQQVESAHPLSRARAWGPSRLEARERAQLLPKRSQFLKGAAACLWATSAQGQTRLRELTLLFPFSWTSELH